MNSVIVIDEVQTVPGKMLTLFNLAVIFLSSVCNATVVLCSATQPALTKLEHPLNNNRNIVPVAKLKEYESVFKRNIISYKGSFSLEQIQGLISELFKKYKSILVVCNKKDEASELFSLCENLYGNVYHLSAGMCIAHRKDTLEKIKTKLSNKDSFDKLLCISTQVIEAGVDISFDSVIRFSAGLDSIVQSAGRCNRNGENNNDSPVWIINCKDEVLHMLREIKDAKTATEAFLQKYCNNSEYFENDISSQKSVDCYYGLLYRNKPESFFDCIFDTNPSLYSLLSDNVFFTGNEGNNYYMHQAFKKAGDIFEVFENKQTSVIVPYGDGEKIISEMYMSGEQIAKHLVDTAKPYTVSVFEYQLKKLEKIGALYALNNGQIYILEKEYYSEKIGLINKKEGEIICNTLIL